MSDQPVKPSILANVEKHVAAEVSQLAPDEIAKVGATADREKGIQIGGAVDVGKGVSIGGHVERAPTGRWGWFVGGMKRWMRTPKS